MQTLATSMRRTCSEDPKEIWGVGWGGEVRYVLSLLFLIRIFFFSGTVYSQHNFVSVCVTPFIRIGA